MTYGTHVANISKDQLSAIDIGTRERAKHNGGLRLATRTITEGGIATSVGAQAMFECALDALLGKDPLQGSLAGSEGSRMDRRAVARSRYEAGMKLRRLFMKAGLVPVKSFNPDGRGGGGDLSDTQESARAQYNSLIRKLGPWGEIVAGPACYDANPDNDRWRANVRKALDRLCEVVE